LANRKQHVFVNNIEGSALSSVKFVKTGVPQGSILGPTLYLIYVNDFKLSINDCHSTKYADDTSLLVTESQEISLQDSAKLVLDKIKIWFSSHKLIMNESKTNVIHFSSSKDVNELIEVIVDDETILTPCDHTKFLGLYIDSKLNWSEHINKLCKKLSVSTFALRYIRDKVERKYLIQIYYAIFQSHILYGIIFWGNSSVTNINRILLVQKKAVRVLAGLNYYDSCKEAFVNLNIMTVINLYLFETLMFVRKNLPKIDCDKVNHTHDTRAKNQFIRPLKHRTHIYEKSATYSGTQLYNALPNAIKQLNISSFKKKLTVYFINNPFYCISEFNARNIV
jgi:hypothetical protein